MEHKDNNITSKEFNLFLNLMIELLKSGKADRVIEIMEQTLDDKTEI